MLSFVYAFLGASLLAFTPVLLFCGIIPGVISFFLGSALVKAAWSAQNEREYQCHLSRLMSEHIARQQVDDMFTAPRQVRRTRRLSLPDGSMAEEVEES